MRVLVTCGATWVPIDDVRVISNISTGEMGHLIAQAFKSHGAAVSIIEGPVTHLLSDRKIRVVKYRYFDELSALLKKELLKKYDIVVHAAAVSDFKLARVSKGKIASDKRLTLKLTATQKLINTIKQLSPDCFLVGFKLEPKLDPKHIFKTVRTLFRSSQCDLVVANTLTGGYQGYLVNADGDILSKVNNKESMARSLAKLLTSRRSL